MKEDSLIDRLCKKIFIQEKTNIEDGFGGFMESWRTIKSTWAEIKPLTASDKYEASKIEEKITHLITIRYFLNLKTNHRILYQDRVFNIRGIVNPFENNKIQEIKAEEIL